MHTQKTNLKLIKINALIIFFIISIFIAIPISNKNSTYPDNARLPQSSYVYHENTTHYASDVCVSGNYAYLANGYSGLAIIEISDPTDPGTAVQKSTAGSTRDILELLS